MTFQNEILFICILFLAHSFVVTYCLQCKNEDNENVDWFVAYKLPKLARTKTNPLIKQGLAYIYMTSEDYSSWKLSEKSIGDNDSMVGLTLNDLYTNKGAYSYVLYNDQPPNGTSVESKGHTKGVVLVNSEESIWLVHSVPHFPPVGESYAYPATGQHYGQSFLCISTNTKTTDTVGLQLQMNQPLIYAYNIDTSVENLVPNLVKAISGKLAQANTTSVQTINSKSGASFESFAKSRKFAKDLYSDLVAVTLKTDLDVETWPNEPNRLPSDCSSNYKVYNIESVSITLANVTFKTTNDHSKWAVSTSGKWICIGDINRAKSQEARGGGTVCLKDARLASRYQQIVGTVQPCSNEILNEIDY